MTRFIRFFFGPAVLLLGIICLLFLVPAVLLADDTTAAAPQSLDLQVALVSITAVVGLVSTLSEGFAKFLHTQTQLTLDGWKARGLTWLISIGVCFAAVWLKLGLFADPVVQATPIYYVAPAFGIIIGLVANGFFGTNVAEWLLTQLKLRSPQSETAPPAQKP